MAPADDALGMFFRDRLASSASALRIEDGQEKVHLFELQIALCNQGKRVGETTEACIQVLFPFILSLSSAW